MSIRLMCICGYNATLADKYVGEYVECPQCHAMLCIPTREEDRGLVRWRCSCGQRLKARLRSAGREIQCPSCGSKTMVPLAEAHDAFIEKRFPAGKQKAETESRAANESQEAPVGASSAQSNPDETAVLESDD